MRRFIKMIMLDIRAMSIAGFVPMVMVTILTVYGIFMYKSAPDELAKNFVNTVLYFSQRLLPPLASWWIIMSFHPYVEDEGAEVLFSCGYSRRLLGIGRVVTFLILFQVIIVISCAALVLFKVIGISELFTFSLILFLQSCFYGCAGFLLVILERSVLWALASMLLLIYMNIWGGIPVISKYFSVTVELDRGLSIGSVWMKLMSLAILSCLFMYIGQKLFDKYRYKSLRVKSS